MHQKSIKLNAILNVIKSLLSVIFPLITYPYASRVLGVENLGKVNFSSSIITYFSLLASLGITTYAIREGAKIREAKNKFSNFANEIFSINVVTTIISYIVLAIVLLVVYKLKEYRLLIIIHSITIIFTTFGVDWINSTYEDYAYITIRSLIVNVISMLGLFLFVKTEDDYYIYAALSVISNGIICLSNFIYCRKYAKFKLTRKINFKKHIKKIITFFANNLAVYVYVNIDTTMLGIMVNDYAVGLYSVAVKVYTILKNIFAAIYTVTIPRLTYFASNNKLQEYRKLITQISSVIILVLLPCAMGLFILSSDIIMILSGEAYLEAVPSLQVLSISIVFALLGGIITQCINISLNKEKVTLKATAISSICNFLLNLYFIRAFNEVGAAITTAISEFIVLIYCIINFKDIFKYIDKSKITKNIITALIGMIIVWIVGEVIKRNISNLILRDLLIMLFSCILYIFVLTITKNEMFIDVLRKIKRRRCKN